MKRMLIDELLAGRIGLSDAATGFMDIESLRALPPEIGDLELAAQEVIRWLKVSSDHDPIAMMQAEAEYKRMCPKE